MSSVPRFKIRMKFSKDCMTSNKQARHSKEPKPGYEFVKDFKKKE